MLRLIIAQLMCLESFIIIRIVIHSAVPPILLKKFAASDLHGFAKTRKTSNISCADWLCVCVFEFLLVFFLGGVDVICLRSLERPF